MRDRHVRIAGAKPMFRFRGNSGLEHSIELNDERLARIVKQCQDLPGYELFQYVDGSGEHCRVDSADVNRYIREICGHDFTAEDFRTWAGAVLAARELHAAGPCRNASAGKRTILGAIKAVARRLGNRPATCLKYYIHPAILDAYTDGTLFPAIAQGEQQTPRMRASGCVPRSIP